MSDITSTFLTRLRALPTATEREALLREMSSGEVEAVVAQYIEDEAQDPKLGSMFAGILRRIAADIRAGKHWGKR